MSEPRPVGPITARVRRQQGPVYRNTLTVDDLLSFRRALEKANETTAIRMPDEAELEFLKSDAPALA